MYVEAEHHTKTVDWRWPDFSPEEMGCRGTGAIKIRTELLDKLQRLRKRLGKPLIINSAYRSEAHNKKVGGARNSYHVRGMAVDVSMQNHDPQVFVEAAKACGFKGIGWYEKQNFIHLDIGPPRTWGAPWKAPMFEPEPKVKAVSTPAKVGIASTLTIAGALEPIKAAATPENFAAVQSAVQPMIAYSDVFQWIFVAAGIGIVGWTVWTKFFRSAP